MRCGNAYGELFPRLNHSAAWVGQKLRSCYRCKTSPTSWENQQHMDMMVSQFFFEHNGLPTSLNYWTEHAAKVTEQCSLPKCEAWIAANPVLGPRKTGPEESTAGLQACYACQNGDAFAWSKTADGQRIYSKLSDIMFGSKLLPSQELAAAADAAAAKRTNGAAVWDMASSSATRSVCNTCYINLHTRSNYFVVMSRYDISKCVKCLEARDTYDETIQLLLSKAAIVYFRHSKQTVSSGKALQISEENSTPVPLLHNVCSRCIGWIAQQQHRCAPELQSPAYIGDKAVHLSSKGTVKDCSCCLSETNADDDITALLRARMHYHMAGMLFDTCLKRPAAWLNMVEQHHHWLAANALPAGAAVYPADVARVLRLGKAAKRGAGSVGPNRNAVGTDVNQVHVLLGARDLYNVRDFLDGVLDEAVSIPLQKKISENFAKVVMANTHAPGHLFHVNDPIATVIIWAFASLPTLWILWPLYMHLKKLQRKQTQGVRKRPGLLVVLWRWLCDCLFKAVAGVAGACRGDSYRYVLSKVVGCLAYAVVLCLSMYAVHHFTIDEWRLWHLLQFPGHSMLHTMCLPCVAELLLPFPVLLRLIVGLLDRLGSAVIVDCRSDWELFLERDQERRLRDQEEGAFKAAAAAAAKEVQKAEARSRQQQQEAASRGRGKKKRQPAARNNDRASSSSRVQSHGSSCALPQPADLSVPTPAELSPVVPVTPKQDTAEGSTTCNAACAANDSIAAAARQRLTSSSSSVVAASSAVVSTVSAHNRSSTAAGSAGTSMVTAKTQASSSHHAQAYGTTDRPTAGTRWQHFDVA
jgi:hypothetical protein